MEWKLKPGKAEKQYWVAHDEILEEKAARIQQINEDFGARLNWLWQRFFEEVPEMEEGKPE